MTWKFQPPSAKDSWKRSATRYKIRKVELSSDAKSDTFAGIDLKAFRFGNGMSNRLIS
jgi:hypothetical protein